MIRSIGLLATTALFSVSQTQEILQIQNNAFNSSYSLTSAQIAAANITEIVTHNVEVALNVERTNRATGSIEEDPFYEPPAIGAKTRPGSLLKVEAYTNTSLYTLAPNTALSRILFTTTNINGSVIPASAYILWPWQAKKFTGSSLNISGVPAVAWAHGTSGFFGECAPSHIRNLWYQFSAPFILALQGYAVVAPDYAGLGVNRTSENEPIFHNWLAHPAAANDLIYAMQAAREAFPELSKHFVTMGHSQGGGAAWATAHRQSLTPVEGYLGTVAGSPLTNINEGIRATGGLGMAPGIAYGLGSIFPSFNYSQLFEPEGIKKLLLAKELSGCNSVLSQLLQEVGSFIKQGWEESWYVRAYSSISDPSRKPISGPMLVLGGTDDTAVPADIVKNAVNETCTLYPESQIRYVSFEGVSHVPVLNAAQQVWLQWIEDRFMGKRAGNGCTSEYLQPLRSMEAYQKELQYYLQLAVQGYTVA